MFSEKSLPKLIIISPIIAIVLITLCTTYIYIETQQQNFKDFSLMFEKNFFQRQKDSLKNELNSIYNYLIHQEKTYSNDAFNRVIKRTYLLKDKLIQLQKDLISNKKKDQVIQNFVNAKISNNNYFFAYDLKNKILIQPKTKNIKAELKADNKFFENYLYFPLGKLFSFEKNNKIVFILYLENLNWIIGNIENISSDINFIKKVSKTYISTLKFNTIGYSWIIDDNKKVINENDNIISLKQKALNSKEGLYLTYHNEKTNNKMLSYTKYFDKWDWLIGTSLDLNYIHKAIVKQKMKLKKRLEGNISTIIYLCIAIVIFVTIISTIISNSISTSFTLYKQNDKKRRKELVDLNLTLEKKIKQGIIEAQQKDRAMLHQSRLAGLGTMISMIAHQWRQPLTELSAILAEIETATEFNQIDKKMIFSNIKDSNKLLAYMSNTIDDFRMFFKPNKKKEFFSLQKVCNDAVSLMKGTFKELNISIEKHFYVDKKLKGYPREFSQVILNLLMNSKDKFIQNNIKNAKIDFFISKSEEKIFVIIRDNAGGIKVENLDKIFEPYFSTKKYTESSGLGLFMSKMIIEQNMNGYLYVFNINDGAQFNIVL